MPIKFYLLSQVLKYLSITEEDDISLELIKAALSSVARTAIIPMQDILRLGNSARMNIPATQVNKSKSSDIDAHKFVTGAWLVEWLGDRDQCR